MFSNWQNPFQIYWEVKQGNVTIILFYLNIWSHFQLCLILARLFKSSIKFQVIEPSKLPELMLWLWIRTESLIELELIVLTNSINFYNLISHLCKPNWDPGMRNLIIHICFAILYLTNIAFGQSNEIHFRLISPSGGFSYNEIRNIIEDGKGFIWMCGHRLECVL